MRVAELTIAKHQCRRAGGASGLGLNHLMHALLDRIDLDGAVPVPYQHLLLIRRQHRQLADFLRRVVDYRLQQARPVPGHARNGIGLEQVAGVGQRGVQLAALLPGVEGQVELGGAALPVDAAQLQAGGSADRGHVGYMRLVVVHHLEQWRVAEAALQFQRFDQALERQVLMGLGAKGGFLDGAQQVVDPGLAVQLGAQHLGVDEEADQAFDFRAVAVGDGHTDADVGLPGVAMQ
ncbi:hypothetical protein PS673_05777 [Pseudomonas fluorescens]|uniref:Uncharacterized protein n=1 Tax=Pseudomonas fluorescens TaxID=294 RepID=A0A5E6XXN7_PSEFL|nr:hypothetical protein PS673_05777 [Pseudomonas fluorescens]